MKFVHDTVLCSLLIETNLQAFYAYKVILEKLQKSISLTGPYASDGDIEAKDKIPVSFV